MMDQDPRYMSIVPVSPVNPFKAAAREMRAGLAELQAVTPDERRMFEAAQASAAWLEHLSSQIDWTTSSPVLIAAAAQLALDGAARAGFVRLLEQVDQLTS